jgi:hypothetical protein
MSQALAVRRWKSSRLELTADVLQAVMQLLTPLRSLSTVPAVAELFKAAEDDRKMDTL